MWSAQVDLFAKMIFRLMRARTFARLSGYLWILNPGYNAQVGLGSKNQFKKLGPGCLVGVGGRLVGVGGNPSIFLSTQQS
jgi:hypothetical protein